ncbi:DMT family transporter [Burkholderia sp. Ac-20353]|uniref:DMT family transporter n=1 Tax=Burkholderia sp. Ac-20353 TaxID=2703894 RepID=UPI00197BE068|nr:DMT family transporter [Burkholderia sp. Ac-20353]
MRLSAKTTGSLPVGSLLLLLPPPLFWAGNFIVGRAMHNDVPPMALSLWRWIIALVFMLPFAFQAMRRDLSKYWKYRWRVLGVSLAGVVSFNSFVYLGLQSTTASNGLLLNSFIPILIVLLAAIFYRQRLYMAQVLGLTLSFAGVVTIVMHGDWSGLASLSISRGDLLIFCAMVSWAFYTLWLRGFPADIDRIGLMGTQIVLALIVLVPLYLYERASGPAPTWNIRSLSALAYLGIFPSVVAYLLYNIGVARVGPTRAGLSIHLIPLFGVVLAALFLRETIHGYHVLGMAAIVAGVACAARNRTDIKRPAPWPTKPLTPL